MIKILQMLRPRYNAFLLLIDLGLMSNFRILLQYCLPQRALTRLAGILSECTWVWFKNWQIGFLIRRYGIRVDDALSSNLADYPTFNSFFTRRLKPGLRPIDSEPRSITSPADGSISQIGTLQQDLLLQAKGISYSLAALLGGQSHLVELFLGGSFATIYLAPKDYHRVHMPVSGTLQETVFIPGQLFSVNTETAQAVPNLFARNERLVSIFKTEHGPVAVILVGAMLVGSIQTVWGATTVSRTILRSQASQPTALQKGDEMGHFKMGSTVILLFGKEAAHWHETLHAASVVQVGESIGTVTP